MLVHSRKQYAGITVMEAGHPFIDRSKAQPAKQPLPHLLAAQALDGAQVLAAGERARADLPSRPQSRSRLLMPRPRECPVPDARGWPSP
jgi:hypothetical protein